VSKSGSQAVQACSDILQNR